MANQLFRNRSNHEEIVLPGAYPTLDDARHEISRRRGTSGQKPVELADLKPSALFQAPSWYKRWPEPGDWEPLGATEQPASTDVLGWYKDPPPAEVPPPSYAELLEKARADMRAEAEANRVKDVAKAREEALAVFRAEATAIFAEQAKAAARAEVTSAKAEATAEAAKPS